MCASLTESQAEFEAKFAKEFVEHFPKHSREDIHRFEELIHGGTITGSTSPISEKTSSLKKSMEPPIPSGTPVFHFYFTDKNGVYRGDYIVKSFDELLLVLPTISGVSVLRTQIAHLSEHSHLSSQIRRSIAKLLNPPIQCTH